MTGFINPLLPPATARATANNTSCNFLPGRIGSCILQDYFHPRLQNDFGTGDSKCDQHRALPP